MGSSHWNWTLLGYQNCRLPVLTIGGCQKEQIVIQGLHCDIGVLNEVILGKQRGLNSCTRGHYFIWVDGVQQFCIDKELFKRFLQLGDFSSAAAEHNLKEERIWWLSRLLQKSTEKEGLRTLSISVGLILTMSNTSWRGSMNLERILENSASNLERDTLELKSMPSYSDSI